MEIEVSLKELGLIVMSLKKLSVQDLMDNSKIDAHSFDDVCKLLNSFELIYSDAKTMNDSVGTGLLERIAGLVE